MKTSVKIFNGERLKELIQRKGISQEKFSEEFGVSVQTVSYWVTGKKKPSADNLEKLSSYFDVPKVCLTDKFPLCSNKEYQKLSEETKNGISRLLFTPMDESIKPLFEYLTIVGKRYDTFDLDTLDKGVIGNTPIFYIIKSILEKKIEDCFLELGVIQKREESTNGHDPEAE